MYTKSIPIWCYAKRFWEYVDIPEDRDQCWLWKGPIRGRYGIFTDGQERMLAHRVAYHLTHKDVEGGPLIEGYVLHHECRNPLCVNPQHVVPITESHHSAIHAKAPRKKPAPKPMRAHCSNGHEYTPENTYWYKNGRSRRECIACRHEYRRKKRAEKKRQKSVEKASRTSSTGVAEIRATSVSGTERT